MSEDDEDLVVILRALPKRYKKALRRHQHLSSLAEIVMDLGRPCIAHFNGELRPEAILPDSEVLEEDLDQICGVITNFDSENR